ncbi:galectin-2-like [Tenrec ecaudatus]|uniref:galectin-2-like n=1 Tax=Tenrec ecaudatus TaxID=94439 RepID=UPI003F5A246E
MKLFKKKRWRVWVCLTLDRHLKFNPFVTSDRNNNRKHSFSAPSQDNFEIINIHMKLGTTLKVKGRIENEADWIEINLGQSADKLNLHFNPRFPESTIVCNSKDGGWGEEQRTDLHCFARGSEVMFEITYEKHQFTVKLPDGHMLTFPNRLGSCPLSYLSTKGKLRISSLKFD